MNDLHSRSRRVSCQSGFNLIEISMALILISIVVGASLNIYKQHKDQMAAQVTENNMNIVVKALSNYVQTNNRLPCPTDPAASAGTFGFERGAVAATISGGRPPGSCDTATARNGLIPYQALNIPYETIRDGWGRYLTYGISPIFTQPNEIYRDEVTYNIEEPLRPGADGQDDGDVQVVHRKCREAGWVNADFDAVNGPKARFCCAYSPSLDRDTDLVIRNRDNSQIISPSRAANTNDVYTAPGNSPRNRMNVPYTNQDKSSSNPRAMPSAVLVSTPGQDFDGDGVVEGEVEAAAFVLVSHGQNGLCAFRGDNTSSRIDCAAPASADEIANGNGQTFYTGQRENNFDDIVLWMTQFGLMAYGGSNSCSLP